MAASDGKKGRKFGRNEKSPSMKRYNAENRCATNKVKKQKRHEKLLASHKAKAAKAVKSK